MLIGFGLPFVFFSVAAGKRKKAFDRQLPDAPATIALTLRAGHGLRIALRAVADDGSPPASEEFNQSWAKRDLDAPCMKRSRRCRANRVGLPRLRRAALNVQSQAGGSLATLFDTLSETVRERQKHAGRSARSPRWEEPRRRS